MKDKVCVHIAAAVDPVGPYLEFEDVNQFYTPVIYDLTDIQIARLMFFGIWSESVHTLPDSRKQKVIDEFHNFRRKREDKPGDSPVLFGTLEMNLRNNESEESKQLDADREAARKRKAKRRKA